MMIMIYPGDTLYWFSLCVSVVALLATLIATPWRAFFSVSARSLLWLGYWLVLSFIWVLRIPVEEVLAMHITGLTAAVFIFGWPLTVLLGLLTLTANQILIPLPAYVFLVNVLIGVLVPVLAGWIAFTVVNRIPVNNLFVFILGGGFWGSVFAMGFTVVSALLIFWISGAWSLQVLLYDNVIMYALSAFPEGFIGGAVLSTITVLWPDLVKNYDDNRYLSG